VNKVRLKIDLPKSNSNSQSISLESSMVNKISTNTVIIMS